MGLFEEEKNPSYTAQLHKTESHILGNFGRVTPIRPNKNTCSYKHTLVYYGLFTETSEMCTTILFLFILLALKDIFAIKVENS